MLPIKSEFFFFSLSQILALRAMTTVVDCFYINKIKNLVFTLSAPSHLYKTTVSKTGVL